MRITLFAKIALLSFYCKSYCATTSFTLPNHNFSIGKNRPKQAGKSWNEKEDLRPLKSPLASMLDVALLNTAYIHSSS